MQFTVKSAAIEKQKSDCLIVGIHQKPKSKSKTIDAINQISDGVIDAVVGQGDLSFKPGETVTLHRVNGLKAPRLMLAAIGDNDGAIKSESYLKFAEGIACALKKSAAKDATISLDNIDVIGRTLEWKIRLMTEIIITELYSFDQLKSDTPTPPALKKVTFVTAQKKVAPFKQGIAEGEAIGNGRNFARTLGNLPGNICHPSYLAEQAKQLAKGQKQLTTKVLGEKQLAELNMHSFLSVGQGSNQESKLIVMEYKGGERSDKPVVLLGKGITFDTGGISLKPPASMDEMKFDMCGAASVFGVMQAVLELDLPINLIGMVAAAENMPGSKATRPGDIVTSMSGKTIAIDNTDAEGRLVLCDALTYAERFKPAAVVDIATLTGACIIALGHHVSGLLSNSDELANSLIDASCESADLAWRLPMLDLYQQQLDSNFADLSNVGGRPAGTITAGCFLSRFAEKYDWAHLDIAGTAWKTGKAKGATGRPVALLVQYLLDRLKSA